MGPTLDVMKDLMVVYLSGEASPDTRRLVEEYAIAHPDYAELLKRSGAAALGEAGPPPASVEMNALRLTRQFILLRSLFFGMGIAFTLAPFTFAFKEGNVTFFLWRDVPGLGTAFASIAVASWVACYVMHRAVRKAGL